MYDTARAGLVEVPASSPVRIYTCGITPYDATHMGHAATYVTYDVLQRHLQHRGFEVRLVRNITDIDDDLFARAARDGVHHLDLAFGQKRRFDLDLEALGVEEPWSEPRATSAIPDIRGLVHTLLELDVAYESGGSVYLDRGAVPTFGSLSGYSRVDMRAIGERRGEDPRDPAKRHPLDTVLWKPSAVGEPEWESPWGSGRPGWHIECVALSLRELGGIDIHGGGCDLVYPHHEFCAGIADVLPETSRAEIWMHQACVHLAGEPMAKSTGNLVFVHELLSSYPGPVLRLAVLSQHYRTPEWTWEATLLDDAARRWRLWSSPRAGTSLPTEVVARALDDDLDVLTALDEIDRAASGGHDVTDAAALLGVQLEVPART